MYGSAGVEPIYAGYNPATWMLEVTGAAKAVKAKAVQADWPQVCAGAAGEHTARAQGQVRAHVRATG